MKAPLKKFDHSLIDKTKGVNVNYQIVDGFIYATISVPGEEDRAVGMEIGHYTVAERISMSAKFMKGVSSSVRYTKPMKEGLNK